MGEAALSFPGVDAMIREIDAAVRESTPEATVSALRKTLCQMIRSRTILLPDCVFQAQPDRYARRELYISPDLGYSVIAMTWGPGQGTPIHDHCGMWCVEGVWAGELEVDQYQLRERDGERFRFEPVGSIQAGTGSAGSLIPPHEYHTIANASSEHVAVSVHVYSGAMTECNIFNPDGDGWYRRCPRRLSLD